MLFCFSADEFILNCFNACSSSQFVTSVAILQTMTSVLASQTQIISELFMTMLGISEIRACCLQIIHLDLKSHNILLGRGGVAKIADVGLAKIMSKSATRASATGTFDWAAPGILTPPPLPLCPPSFTHLTPSPCAHLAYHRFITLAQSFFVLISLAVQFHYRTLDTVQNNGHNDQRSIHATESTSYCPHIAICARLHLSCPVNAWQVHTRQTLHR